MVYFYDWGSFNAGAPGLPVEDFEEGVVAPGGVEGCPAPLDSTSNNACFVPGDILDGIRFSDDPGPDPDGIALIGSGFNGNASKAVLANTFTDSFVISFYHPANAVGFEVMAQTSADNVIISIYAVDGALLDTRVVAATNAGTFFGFVSDIQIGSITINSPTNQSEGVDNIAFGLLSNRVTFYNTWGSFNADFSGLPVEDFEEGNVAPGDIEGCTAPLDYTTNDICFQPGDILEGVRFVDNPGPGPDYYIALLSAGVVGNPSQSIVADTFSDSLDVFFFHPVNTVGFDLVSIFSDSEVLITIYGPGDVVLWQARSNGTNAGSFFGFHTTDQITRVNLNSVAGQAEGVDNLAFGWVSELSSFYMDRGSFDSHIPGLAVEDFEEGNVADGAIKSCPAPLDSTNNDDCFTPGEIEEGIQFVDNPGPGPDPIYLALSGAGFFGNTSKHLVADTFTDSLDIFFLEPVNAVGFDLISIFGEGPVIISAFGPGNELVLQVEVVGTNAGTNFWGMNFNQQITRINLYSPSGQAEGVDNIAFGWKTNFQIYSSRSAFETNFTSLVFEDFEDGDVDPGNVEACAAPLDSTTNDNCFTPGEIPAGIRFLDNYGPDFDGLALLGTGSFWGNVSKYINANYFVDSFDMYFTQPVNTVGFDLTSLFGSSIEAITLYGEDGEMLFRFQGTSTLNGTFWGVHTPALIGRINLDSNTGDGEGVDNLSFGLAYLTMVPVTFK